MTTEQIEKYRKYRAEHPFLGAQNALRWAKAPDASKGWEELRNSESWATVRESFTLTITLHDQSIFPMPDKRGNTEFGSYVDEVTNYHDHSNTMNWDGNWPPPRESAPLGLPYTSIRYDGPGWVQGEPGGYFIPSEIEAQFAYYRSAGQSKAVAWDLTKAWVESQISMLFHSPLTNMTVVVTAYRNGIKLGSAAMGTDVAGDDESRAYIFTMVEEYGMVDEAIAEAKANIDKLTADAS